MSENDFSKIIGSFRQQILVGGFDITEWVTSVNVSRSIAQPTGKWTINLRPIIGNDNLMLRLPVDLNDLVEIRIDRKMQGETKVVMRGMLDAEDMSEKPSGGLDGSPNRTYMISGSDLGKMLERRQNFIPPDRSERSISQQVSSTTDLMNNIATYADTLPSATKTNVDENGDTIITLSAWVKYFVSVVYKSEYETINNSRAKGTNDFSFIIDDDLPEVADTIERFKVSVLIVNNMSGSYWQFIKYYCIQPFIETFFEDTNDSTIFHVRWTPLRMRVQNGNGFKYYFPTQHSNGRPWRKKPISKITITTKEILEKQIRRQDTDRCTYFFVSLNPWGDGSSQKFQIDDEEGSNHVGSNPYWDDEGIKQFGVRPMVVEIPWLNTVPAADAATGDIHGSTWTFDIKNILNDLNVWLVNTMTFADQLYTGVLIVLGNSDITVGCEVWVEDSQEHYYVESVEHAWQTFPAPQFITRLGVSRGIIDKPFSANENKFIRVAKGERKARLSMGILAPSGGDTEVKTVVDTSTNLAGTGPNPYGLSVPPAGRP